MYLLYTSATPAEVIDHYHCFLLANFDSSTICQIMLEMKLLTEKDLVYSAKMYSDYQRNSFLLDRLLVTNTTSIVEFCHLLQNAENQQDIGDMLINGKNKSQVYSYCIITNCICGNFKGCEIYGFHFKLASTKCIRYSHFVFFIVQI